MRDLYRKHKRPQMKLKTAGAAGGTSIEATGKWCYVTHFATSQVGAGTSVVLRAGDSSSVWVVIHTGANETYEYTLSHPLRVNGLEVAVSAGTGKWNLVYYVEE